MTREEAERIYLELWGLPSGIPGNGIAMITLLERLGVLKLEEPNSDSLADIENTKRAIDCLSRVEVWISGKIVGWNGNVLQHGILSHGSACDVIGALERSGFKVVRK